MVKHYCTVTVKGGSHFEELVTREVTKPGSMNWWKAFDAEPNWTGEVREISTLSKEDLERFDILHLTLAGVNVPVIINIRKALGESSSTLLILSTDYTFENFEAGFNHPLDIHKAVRCADFIFAQEPVQRELYDYIVKEYMKKKWSVPVIPHPVDTQGIKAMYVKPEQRLDLVAYVYHKYQRCLTVPSMLLDGLGVPSLMLGYLDLEALKLGRGPGKDVPAGFFHFNAGWLDWKTYIYMLRHCTIGLDFWVIHSYSRVPLEFACLGIPAVCTSHSYTGTLLYPETTHKPWDLQALRKSLARLVKDEEFWSQTAAYAFEKVEEMNWHNSVQKLLNALKERGFHV